MCASNSSLISATTSLRSRLPRDEDKATLLNMEESPSCFDVSTSNVNPFFFPEPSSTLFTTILSELLFSSVKLIEPPDSSTNLINHRHHHLLSSSKPKTTKLISNKTSSSSSTTTLFTTTTHGHGHSHSQILLAGPGPGPHIINTCRQSQYHRASTGYAVALLDAARRHNVVEAVSRDVKKLLSMSMMLGGEILMKEVVKQGIRLGFQKHLVKLVKLLVENGKVDLVRRVLSEYGHRVFVKMSKRGILPHHLIGRIKK